MCYKIKNFAKLWQTLSQTVAAGHLTESITDDCLIKTQQVQKEIKRVKIMDEHWGFWKLFKAWQFFKVFSVVCNFQNMCLGNLFFLSQSSDFVIYKQFLPLYQANFLPLLLTEKMLKQTISLKNQNWKVLKLLFLYYFIFLSIPEFLLPLTSSLDQLG